jgi:hypothetical protein
MDLGGGVSAYWRIGGVWWRVACEIPELHYIWCSNITEIFSSFPLRDEVVSRRKGYKMVNFLPKIGGGRVAHLIQNARQNRGGKGAGNENFRVSFFFFDMVLISIIIVYPCNSKLCPCKHLVLDI